MSVKPKWVEKILKGEKTIEIRKTKPNCELPTLCYIYCTKDRNETLFVSTTDQEKTFLRQTKKYGFGVLYDPEEFYVGNGHIVAKFTVNKVEKMTNDLCEKACIERGELLKYLGDKDGYAWYIENLKIYEQGKDLEIDPPMSWCYIER